MSELSESRVLAELPGRHARREPDAVALIYGERVTPYPLFVRHIHQVANGLGDLGVGRGTRIGYLGKNSDLFLELLFGAWRHPRSTRSWPTPELPCCSLRRILPQQRPRSTAARH
jgi:acyl-CoA synthetase (AMP-forming)/AMP-acid ligase II